MKKWIILFIYTLILFFIMPIETTNAAGGVLSGHVVKSDGKTPIAGAIVVASTAAGTRMGSVETLSNGKFIFVDLPAGNYDLDAFAEDYNFSDKSNISVMSDKITSDINFMLFESASIAGKVTESDGLAPIAGAKVIMYDVERMPRTSAITDENGKYEIKNLFPDTYGVRAEISGYAFSVKWPIEVKEGQKIGDVNFILKKGASISGRVLDQNTQKPIEEAIVIPIAFNGNVYGIHLTNSDGGYSISDLPDGDYGFLIRAENYLDLTKEITITVGQTITNANFYLEPSQ